MPRKGDLKWEMENYKSCTAGEGSKRWRWQACSQFNRRGDWRLSPPSAHSKNCADTTLLQLPLCGPRWRGRGSHRPGFWAVQLPRGLPEPEHARVGAFRVCTPTPMMGLSQVEGTSGQACPGHPASVVAVGRKWNEDSQAVHAVKSTGCL